MKIFFVTGTSRGIGAALGHALLGSDHVVHAFSRGDNPGLRQTAADKGFALHYHQIDLSDLAAVEALFGDLFDQLNPATTDQICVIHNAGLLEPVRAIGKGSLVADQERLMQVNVLAPMAINEQLLARVQDWPISRQVLHISSGAGKRATHAWSAYCSSKAALDMYAQCLAGEQATESHPVQTMALAPGVVETEMQETLRSKSAEEFHLVERFHRIKEEGTFFTPEFVASHILEVLKDPNFGEPVIQDLRDIVGRNQQ